MLRQGGGWIFVTLLHLPQKSAHVYVITTFNRILQGIAHSGVAKLGHTGARAPALEAVPTSAGKHANYWYVIDRKSGAK